MTNREKFIKVFNEIPQTECPLIDCNHTACPYNYDHINCIDQRKNMSMWWELEYKEPTRKRGCTIEQFFEYMKENNLFEVIVNIRYKYSYENNYTYSNEYLCYHFEHDTFEWLNDWDEGQKDVEILGYISVDSIIDFIELEGK